MHFAHSTQDPDRNGWQRLQCHSEEVSFLASLRAKKFNAERLGALVGLLHDLGKYSREFQDYISGKGTSPDHATAGAVEILRMAAAAGPDRFSALIGAYCIAGHHAGLANWRGERALRERLTKPLPELDSIWRQELTPDASQLFPENFKWHEDKVRAPFQLAMFGRMIFSCLVDADFGDTEAFYVQLEGKQVDREWPALPAIVGDLIARFNAHMGRVQASSVNNPLGSLRSDILAHARSKAALPRGVFTMDVPTGGGKTLASLGFALDHAEAHDMDRIVYGIPFTSIIDQTSEIFRRVLGDDFILEHHSSIEDTLQGRKPPDQEGERDIRDKMQLAMEDWAAPIVVTTNVQLFESLFANRTSRCRKLHNLANAVIILDEAQTIPLPVLRPCVAALDELVRNYGCSVVLCTATQPALKAPRFKGGFNLSPERELAPDPKALAEKLRRVTLSIRAEPCTDAELAHEIASFDQSLVIVNSRKHALELYNATRAAGLAGVIHLTTRQTAADRRRILAAIREDLANKRPCRVVATSLIEAGVDVDFPRIWRAQAGLDQIMRGSADRNANATRSAANEGRRSPRGSAVKSDALNLRVLVCLLLLNSWNWPQAFPSPGFRSPPGA